MRLFFFICLVLALVLCTVSLFVGGNPGIGWDEVAVLGSMLALLIAVGIMAWRGKVFRLKGKWVYHNETGE